jgi:hypothetical protein
MALEIDIFAMQRWRGGVQGRWLRRGAAGQGRSGSPDPSTAEVIGRLGHEHTR